MNIVEYTKIFHEMEVKSKLFELKTSDNIYFWDIVRYDVFFFIYRSIQGDKSTDVKNIKADKTLLRVLDRISYLINDLKYLLRNSGEKKYLIFRCSRNFINGKEVDIISDEYMKFIGNDSFVIETFNKHKDVTSFNNYALLLYKKLYCALNKTKDTYNIDSIVKNTFGLDIHLDEFIKVRVTSFKAERSYYRMLFKKLKPQAIFLVQNGIQKAIMYVGREMEIPVIEFQHGLINYCHPAYSYPDEIKKYKNNEFIVPDNFFAFSEYWIKNVNYPVKRSYPMGNSHYYTFVPPVNEDRDEITFISADTYHQKVEEYLDYFLEHRPEAKVNLKLHPNQGKEVQRIRQKYSVYKNVTVYYTEVTVKELLKRSREIIILTSTCGYEAIQYGCNLGIIRDEMSYDIQDLFDHPNTRVFDTPEDILNKPMNQPITTIFFENFKADEFKKYMIQLEKNTKNKNMGA